MALLEVVFLERIHVVSSSVFLLFLGGLVVGGDEVDRFAVRRPVDVARGGRVMGEASRLAALRAEQVDLVAGVRIAARREGDQLPVRRPPRAALAALAERELHLAGAVGIDAIDVADAAIGLPIGLVDRKQDLLPIRRQLRVADDRLLDGIDEGPRALALRSLGEGGLFRRGGERNQQAHHEGEGLSSALHRLLLQM